MGFAAMGLAGIGRNIVADPVNTLVKYGKNLFSASSIIIGLAWYNSWRNQLNGVGTFEVPVPGLTKKQRGGAPDRPDPAPPASFYDVNSSSGNSIGAIANSVAQLPGGQVIPTSKHVKWGRIDQGQDLQVRPGSALKSLGDGIIKLVLNDPGGFGTNYPVVHYTTGPLAGQDVYYGHTHSMFKPGTRIRAGQLFTKTGYGTAQEGNARTPGWAEVGFWPPGSMKAGAKIAPILHRHM